MSFIYLNQIECRLSQSQPCKAQSRKENPQLLIVSTWTLFEQFGLYAITKIARCNLSPA